MEKYLLKDADRKLLSALDGQGRISINKLAKKLNLSKDGANYRFKKLINEGVITRCYAEINITKLGYMIGKVTLQFQNIDNQISEEIFNHLKKDPNVIWVAFCSGRWDCVFGLFVRDSYEMQQLLNNLYEKYGKYILLKEVLIEPEYYRVNRGWLTEKKEKFISKVGGKIEINADELDLRILEILTNECRTPILDIAIKLKQASSTIINRIKILEKKGIIQNYYLGLNLKKIGMEFCKAFVYLQNPSKEEYQKLVDYCLKHPNVTALSKMVGSWEMELEMEVNNFDEFYSIMNDIKTKFKNVVRSYEAVTITNENRLDYSKFLQISRKI